MLDHWLMSQKGNIRPSRTASAVAVMGGIILLLFGAFVIVPNSHDAPGPAKLFMAVWFLLGIGMVVYHFINAAGGPVPPGEVVDVEIDASAKASRTAKERLAELQELKQS